MRGIELLNFDLGDGDDTFDGGSWPNKIELDGGPGKDNLIGGLRTGRDQTSPGGDTIDGGDGFDVVKLATNDSLVKITDDDDRVGRLRERRRIQEMEALDYVRRGSRSRTR